MVDNNWCMSDTLDNYSFPDVPNNPNKFEEVSLDDSNFLNNLNLEGIDLILENLAASTSTTLGNVTSNQEKSETLNISHCSYKNVELQEATTSTSLQDIQKNETTNQLHGIYSIQESTQIKNTDVEMKEFNTEHSKIDKNSENNNHINLDIVCTSISSQIVENEVLQMSCDSITIDRNDKEKQLIPTSNLELSSWHLPETVLEKYAKKNITKMFQWQYDCLSKPKLLQNLGNLIYSAPTSAGKTLVAEIVALKTIFNRKKKVIFILPFVSIVREKMYYFQEILSNSGLRAEGFMGSYNPPGGFDAVQFAICTIEKANALINRLLELGRMDEIGAVFVDEMHLLGDSSRGYLLELLLTKIRYISIKLTINIQIIGMSATLPNLDELANWLGAELYSTNFRPIPLYEQVCVNKELYNNEFKLIKKLEDDDCVLHQCLETILDGHSVLVFCPTKNWCESLSMQLSQAFWKIGNANNSSGIELRQQIKAELIVEVLEQLKYSPIGLDSVLKKTISFGVAFHHAGLTIDERDIIEGGFRSGAIKVLVATSTLSSGVNLPARKVIIRSPNFYGSPLDLLTYRQMIGRAGRMGKDTQGESVLICSQISEFKIAKQLVVGSLPPVKSCLQSSGKLKRAVLEVIASGVATTMEELKLFVNCTLLAVNSSNQDEYLEEILKFLIEHEFIRLISNNYLPTAFGKACLASSISPEDGIPMLAELEKARKCFVLETELHLIYLVTPYSACHSWGNIDWIMYLTLWDKLPKPMKRVGELVGISDYFIVNATRGKLDQNPHKSLIHKRFFVALALQDLVNEVPLIEVCEKFNCNRGALQSLQQSSATFAGMITAFSKQLGWSSVEILLAQFQDRLQFGVSRDLLDLMRLPILNGKLARILYKAGIETLVQLANSGIDQLETILYQSIPFATNVQQQKIKTVWIAGKNGLTEREAADLLISTARQYLECEMGLKDAKWQSMTLNNNSESFTLQLSTDFSGKLNLSNDDESVLAATPENPSIVTPCTVKKSKIPLNSLRTTYKAIKIDQGNCETLFNNSMIALSTVTTKRNTSTEIGIATQSSTKEEMIYNNNILDGIYVFSGNELFYLTIDETTKDLTKILKKTIQNSLKTFKIFNAKEQIKILSGCLHVGFQCRLEDPLVINWLLRGEEKMQNLHEMILHYCDANTYMKQLKELSQNEPQFWSNFTEVADINLLAAIQCVCTWYLVEELKSRLVNTIPKVAQTILKGFSSSFETEMQTINIIANLEMNGMSIDKASLENLIELLKEQQTCIEKKAFSLAGRRFSFSSTKDIAKVIGTYSGKKVSTKKKLLEQNDHPISNLVILWRKVNFTLTKIIYPLTKHCQSKRIYGTYENRTATGRLTMHEPSIQMIPKDFYIENPINNHKVLISCRGIFNCPEGYVLVSADYCQLELRILSYLSKDKMLNQIMLSPGDIFKSIAAQWNNVSEEMVDPIMRHNAKQLCYGIIYGMGANGLAEQLETTAEAATRFMDTFKATYPGINTFIIKTIQLCKETGYVETITGRRRWLPNITDSDSCNRSQAERQAVNTTVQGSAADLVKNAMIAVDNKMATVFKKSRFKPKLILHLHDELIYEVCEKYLEKTVKILRSGMQNSAVGFGYFPIKVKVGKSWSDLKDYMP